MEELLPLELSQSVGIRHTSLLLLEVMKSNVGWFTENFFITVSLDESDQLFSFILTINYSTILEDRIWYYRISSINKSDFTKSIIFYVKKDTDKFSLYVEMNDNRLYFLYLKRLYIGELKESAFSTALSKVTFPIKEQNPLPDGIEQIIFE